MSRKKINALRFVTVALLTIVVSILGKIALNSRSPAADDINYLSKIQPNDRSRVNYATQSLQSNNAMVRNAAAQGLGRIGPLAESATPDLITALNDPSPFVVASAAWALGNIRADDPRVIGELIKKLTDKDGEVRRYAAYALALYGPKAHEAIPDLKSALQDKHMAYMAVRALGEMGNAARPLIPDMAELLSSPNEADRAEAALALSQLKPLPQALEASIVKLKQDPSALVREIAQRAEANLHDTPRTVTTQSGIMDYIEWLLNGQR